MVQSQFPCLSPEPCNL